MALNEKGPFVWLFEGEMHGRWAVNSSFKYLQVDTKNCFLVKSAYLKIAGC